MLGGCIKLSTSLWMYSFFCGGFEFSSNIGRVFFVLPFFPLIPASGWVFIVKGFLVVRVDEFRHVRRTDELMIVMKHFTLPFDRSMIWVRAWRA